LALKEENILSDDDKNTQREGGIFKKFMRHIVWCAHVCSITASLKDIKGQFLIRTPMLMQGRLKLTKTNQIHLKWVSV